MFLRFRDTEGYVLYCRTAGGQRRLPQLLLWHVQFHPSMRVHVCSTCGLNYQALTSCFHTQTPATGGAGVMACLSMQHDTAPIFPTVQTQQRRVLRPVPLKQDTREGSVAISDAP